MLCCKCEQREQTCKGYCAECRSAYIKQHYVNNKAYYKAKVKDRKVALRYQLWRYLKEHPCIDCGETDTICLEFDHVRGEKTREVTRMVQHGVSWDKVLLEIDKCDIRCASCHSKKTAKSSGHWFLRFEAGFEIGV